MERIIRQITDRLLEQLPDSQEYFSLQEFRSWKFPSYIIKRIEVELERNLAESIRPPKTDWANMNTEPVQKAWRRFLNAIRAEARLPASYAKTVIETAVADVIEMLVQPRKILPEVIFGPDRSLSYEEVLERMDAIVVYRHFARLIPRYMEKRGLDQISREKCGDIIHKADEKLTSGYSPLNWAQMLEPLFLLADEQIDTNLLRLFFEGKNMPRVARKFDLMDTNVTRAEFIEVLSSPDLLNMEGYEQPQSDLFQEGAEKGDEQGRKKPPREKQAGKDQKSIGDKEMEGEKDPVDLFHDTRNKKNLPEKEEREPSPADTGEPEEDDLNTTFVREQQEEAEMDEPAVEDNDNEGGDDGNSINALFADDSEQERVGEEPAAGLKPGHTMEPEPEPEKEKEEEEEEKDTSPGKMAGDEEPEHEKKINKRPVDETGDNDRGEGYEKGENNPKREAGESAGVKLENGRTDAEASGGEDQPEEGNNDEESEVPMWKRYLSDEEKEALKKEEREELDEETDEDGFIEEPIIDLTKDQEPDEQAIRLIEQELEDDRDRFIDEIFRGSEWAYDEALEEIAGKENWRNASRYIEKEVFKRNLVDMYSEAAVDFTDRLQTYFLEQSKS